jgi:hypothetical protein
MNDYVFGWMLVTERGEFIALSASYRDIFQLYVTHREFDYHSGSKYPGTLMILLWHGDGTVQIRRNPYGPWDNAFTPDGLHYYPRFEDETETRCPVCLSITGKKDA